MDHVLLYVYIPLKLNVSSERDSQMKNVEKMVSVIVPVYQTKKYLDSCIKSILNQTYKNIEVILIDDGSNDGSEVLCEKYSRKYENVISIHQKNKGVSHARNKGIDYANGEYILFVDSDDFIDLNYLENALNIFGSEHIDMYLCGFQDVRNSGKIKGKKSYPGVNNGVREYNNIDSFILRLFGSTTLHAIGTKIYKREIIQKNNIKFKETWKYYEDIYFCLEYLKCCKTIYIHNAIMYYYQRDIPNSLLKQHMNWEYRNIYKTFLLLFELAKLNHKNLGEKRVFYKLYLSHIQFFVGSKILEQKYYTINIHRLYKILFDDVFYRNALYCFKSKNYMEYFCTKHKCFLGAYLIHKYQFSKKI